MLALACRANVARSVARQRLSPCLSRAQSKPFSNTAVWLNALDKTEPGQPQQDSVLEQSQVSKKQSPPGTKRSKRRRRTIPSRAALEAAKRILIKQLRQENVSNSLSPKQQKRADWVVDPIQLCMQDPIGPSLEFDAHHDDSQAHHRESSQAVAGTLEAVLGVNGQPVTLQERLRRSISTSKGEPDEEALRMVELAKKAKKAARNPKAVKEKKIEASEEHKARKSKKKDDAPTERIDTSSPAPKKRRTRVMKNATFGKIRPQQLTLNPIETETTLPIPKLSHGLDRVLFNPGVYSMQDPRSRVYNFDPYLASIMPVQEFDFAALKEYTTSSRDPMLRTLCAKYGKKYAGSTSSMTALLSHFHYLISQWRPLSYDYITPAAYPEVVNFTNILRAPASVYLRYKDGCYAIDSDKQYDKENVLSMLGKSMEKLLTLPKEEFEMYRLTKSHQLSDEVKQAEEAYHYTTLGDFLMRSQLDAHDSRLPNAGVFDLKTRAVVSIRMNVHNPDRGKGYEIRGRHGPWESFEREYVDMIRAAFLKYSLQVRMGRMDGIFVAYHNTQRIFGFQYISLEEMDQSIHGANDLKLGDQEFKASLSILNDLLNKATEKFPERSLRIHAETRPTTDPTMYFMVEAVQDEEMEATAEDEQIRVEEIKNQIEDLSKQEHAEEALAAKPKPEEALDFGDDQATDEPNGVHEEEEADEVEGEDEESVEDEATQDHVEEEDRLSRASDQEFDALETTSNAQPAEAVDGDGQYEAVDSNVETSDDHASNIEESLFTGPTAEVTEDSIQVRDDVNSALDLSENSDEPASVAVEQSSALEETREGDEDGTVLDSETARPSTEQEENGDLSDTAAAAEEHDGPGAAGHGPVNSDTSSKTNEKNVLGFVVTIKNRVNGKFVTRPTGNESPFAWEVQYAVSEMPSQKAVEVLHSVKKRRKGILADDQGRKDMAWDYMFGGQLPRMSKSGEKFRERMRREEEGKSVYVAWDQAPFSESEEQPASTTSELSSDSR